jgi:acyl dehydratase
VNYGFDKVRFTTAVPVGSRVRASSRIEQVTVLEGAVQIRLKTSFEVEGTSKPAAIVESIARYVR